MRQSLSRLKRQIPTFQDYGMDSVCRDAVTTGLNHLLRGITTEGCTVRISFHTCKQALKEMSRIKITFQAFLSL